MNHHHSHPNLLALSIWWKREVWARLRTFVTDNAHILVLSLGGWVLFMLIAFSAFYGAALNAFFCCLTQSAMPDLSGSSWDAVAYRFCYMHMAGVNMAGLVLAAGAWFSAWRFVKSMGPMPIGKLARQTALFAIPFGLAFPWVLTLGGIILAAYLPRGLFHGGKALVRTMVHAGPALRARREQLFSDHPDLAAKAQRKALDGQIPDATGSGASKPRL